jgi:excisionase family DNA binding protein
MTTVTTGQAAKRLGVSISAIKGMIARKEIRGVKLGAWYRINEAEVERLERKAGGN